MLRQTLSTASRLSRVSATVSRSTRTPAFTSAVRPSLFTFRYASSSSPNSNDGIPGSSEFDALAANLKASPIFTAIQSNEKAMAAIRAIGEKIKDKGYDTTKPPSSWEMMKLAMDPEFRQASMTLMSELKEAGIELTPETIQDLMKTAPPSDKK